MSVLDARNGHPLQAFYVGGNPVAMAVDGRTGRVFVVDNGNNSVAIVDGRRGAVLVTIKLHNQPAAVEVDPRRGRAFVAVAGSVTVLNTRTAKVVGSIPTRGFPQAMGQDVSTGHVFVCAQDDTYPQPKNGLFDFLDALRARVTRQPQRVTRTLPLPAAKVYILDEAR